MGLAEIIRLRQQRAEDDFMIYFKKIQNLSILVVLILNEAFFFVEQQTVTIKIRNRFFSIIIIFVNAEKEKYFWTNLLKEVNLFLNFNVHKKEQIYYLLFLFLRNECKFTPTCFYLL